MAEIKEQDGVFEIIDASGLHPDLTNSDILPTPIADRTWNMWHFAALWVGMAVCVPTYMLASYMIVGGLSWKEALTMILLGNLVVSIPMVLNAHAGTKYGIPFPVFGRASFGFRGIQFPSILRAIVACGWFGVQTWMGGLSILAIIAILAGNPALNSDWNWQFGGFMIFWLINIYFVIAGTESIKILEELSAPILLAIGLIMLWWGVSNAGGMAKVLDASYEFKKPTVEFVKEGTGAKLLFNFVKDREGKSRVRAIKYLTYGRGDDYLKQLAAIPFTPFAETTKSLPEGEVGLNKKIAIQFQGGDEKKVSSVITADLKNSPLVPGETPWGEYLKWLTAMVAFWATLALNIPDLTRLGKSQKDQIVGQFLGLPTTMVFYSFIGVACTCAAILIYDDILITQDAPWAPVTLLARFEGNGFVMILAQLSILLATLSTNIAANVVSPANCFANFWPQRISFKVGGVIAGVIGILIMPWRLEGAIVGFLLTYGAILGPVVAILLADYFFIRGKTLNLVDLYREEGDYAYSSGINWNAFIAFGLGAGVVFLGMGVPELKVIYDSGWFTGFFIAFFVYIPLMKMGKQSAGLPA